MGAVDLVCWVLVGVLAAGATRLSSIYWHRDWFRQGLMWDQAFHFAVITHLQSGRPYEGVPGFLMRDEPDSYPLLFHRFAALFPSVVLQRRPWLPSLLLYALSGGLATGYVHYLNAAYFEGAAVWLELGFIAFYCFGIPNFVLNGNAVLYLSLAERLLGRLTTSWYFLALGAAMAFDDGPSVAIAALAGGLAGVSSMFARQAIAFSTPLAALFAASAVPLAAFSGALAVALLVDRGYFLRGLRQMTEFSRAYLAYTKRSGWMKPALSRFIDWRKVFGRGLPLWTRLNELQTMEPTRAILHHADVLAILAIAVLDSQAVPAAYVAIAIATVTVYLVTSTPAVNHLGEATRYLEFNLSLATPFLLSLAMARGGDSAAPFVGLLVVWTIVFGLWNLYLWQRFERHPRSDELREFLTRLGLSAKDTVFPVPFTLGGSIHVRAPASRVLMYQGTAVSRKVYAKFCDDVPFLKRDWAALRDEFHVTYVVAMKYVLKEMNRLVGWQYDFSSLEKVAESEHYVAWRMSSPTGAAV